MAHPSDTTLNLLEQLIAFDTTSYKSNLELIDFVREYLSSQGLSSKLDFNREKTKANLYAVIGPEGVPGGIALSGHTDVVPVEGQSWTVDPWQLLSANDRYYGRGTTDMKGFIAVVLAAVPRMVNEPPRKMF